MIEINQSNQQIHYLLFLFFSHLPFQLYFQLKGKFSLRLLLANTFKPGFCIVVFDLMSVGTDLSLSKQGPRDLREIPFSVSSRLGHARLRQREGVALMGGEWNNV